MELRQWTTRMPWSIVAVSLVLVAVGFAGIARAEELAELNGRGLVRQGMWAALALAAMAAVTVVSYRAIGRWSYAALAVSIVLLAAVFYFPPINGARRWIPLGPANLQPSEIAKVAFILALARWLMYRENLRQLPALFVPLVLCLTPMLLILKEPDLGTALVFPPVLLAMLLAAGVRVRDLACVLLAALMLVPVLWSQMNREQRSRVTALWEPTTAGTRPSDDAWQLYQSKQMHALGGWTGSYFTGDAVDDPFVYQLPAAKTDFIFSVIGERFGLLGTGGVLLAYALLTWRGLAVAAATREPFGRLVAVGFTALVAVQALINTSMTIGLAPVTGLALPLVSYGGSSLVSTALALGFVLNVGLRPGYEVTGGPFRFGEDPSPGKGVKTISSGRTS